MGSNWNRRSLAAKARRNRKAKNRCRERIAWAVQHLGGKCVNCGEADLDKLQFHHLDPKTKNPKYRGISDAAKWAWEKFKKEINKCALLCFNCHIQEHRANGYTILSEVYVPELNFGPYLDEELEEFEQEIWGEE